MIIQKIKFHNILVYHGDQSIEIPSKGASSLTVVVGPNNSGKTSFIRGLKFWFYGQKGIAGGTLPQLLNNKAKADTEIGNTLEAWVEVTFQQDSVRCIETTCLRRNLVGKRIGDDRWEIKESSLKEIRERARVEHSPDIERKLQSRLCLESSIHYRRTEARSRLQGLHCRRGEWRVVPNLPAVSTKSRTPSSRTGTMLFFMPCTSGRPILKLALRVDE